MTPFGPLGNKPFENTGKKEIARNEQFLLFPQCFLPIWITFCHFHQIWNCRLQTLSVWKSLKFVVWYWVKQNSPSKCWVPLTVRMTALTLSQTSPGFYVSAVQIFWKHCRKRRNCSLRTISPFPHSFLSVWRVSCHFQQIWNCCLQTPSVWKCLKFVVWERVTKNAGF